MIATTEAGEGEKSVPKYIGCKDLRSLASKLKNMPTQARFCYHEESMKDALFLLAHNEENSRLIPQMPDMGRDCLPRFAMHQQVASTAGENVELRPMPYRPLVQSEHSSVTAANPDGWCKPRHADSLVEDSDLQRRVDGLIVRNRLFAASIVASNKIERAPPIRIWDNEVQVNAGILTDHCVLLAEATLAAASIPGLKNAHERFAGGATAPAGLCMTEYVATDGYTNNAKQQPKQYLEDNHVFPKAVAKHGKEKASKVLGVLGKGSVSFEGMDVDSDGDGDGNGNGAPLQAQAQAMETDGPVAGEAGPSSTLSRKRQREEEVSAATTQVVDLTKRSEQKDEDDDGNNTLETVYALPHSFDIIPIHLSASMASLLYDDEVENDRKQLAAAYGNKYGFKANTEHAQLTLPFPGYLDDARQLISLRRRTTPNPDGDVPVKDRISGEEMYNVKYVSACLGRKATLHDCKEWAKQRAGASQYYGVKGNLFSKSVWRRHAHAALLSRGLISSTTENAANLVRYGSSQLFSRLVEYASQKPETPYTQYQLAPVEANSYRAVEEDDTAKLAAQLEKQRKIDAGELGLEEEGEVAEEEASVMCLDPGMAAVPMF